MLTSITPLGERGRANRWGRTATAYVVASALAGAALGAVLGAVGSGIDPSRDDALLALAAVAVVAAILDGLDRRPPSWRRQVNENWLQTYRGWVYGAGYGGQLGLGVVTIVTSATTYAVLAAEVLVASPADGAGLGLVFGLARAMPLLLAHRVQTTRQLAALHTRVVGASTAVRWSGVAVSVVVAATAVGVTT
jgi:sulfite exporter TauE/SafE